MIAILVPSTTTPGRFEQSYAGEIVTHPLNPAFKAVQLDNGNFFTVTPDGAIRVDAVASAWQAFVVSTNSNFLVARRDAGVTYIVPFVAFDGPAIP